MKTCSKCRIEKDSDDFPKRKASNDGLASWCKACKSAHSAKVYSLNEEYREQRKRTNEARKNVNREYLWKYLLEHPCVDCGHSDPRVLEFDHVDRADKAWNVPSMLSWSWSSIQYEIAKCEVRCANCHSIRTQEQLGTWRIKR